MIGSFLFFGVFVGLSSQEDVVKDMERLYQHRILAGCIGVFFLFLGYSALKTVVKASCKDEFFVCEKGTIAISAIEDIVVKTIRRSEDVKSVRHRIRIKEGILQVGADVTIFAGKPANVVVEMLREELLKKFKSYVGITDENIVLSVAVKNVIDVEDKKGSSFVDKVKDFFS